MQDLYPSRGREEKIIERCDPTVYGSNNSGDYSLDELGKREYEANGFIVLPNLFGAKEIEMLNLELERLSCDSNLLDHEEFICEPESHELRTIFNPHLFSKLVSKGWRQFWDN